MFGSHVHSSVGRAAMLPAAPLTHSLTLRSPHAALRLRAQPCVVLSAAFNFHVRSLAFFSPLSFQPGFCLSALNHRKCCPSFFSSCFVLLFLLLLSLRSHKQNYEMPLSVKSLNSLTILIYHRHRPRVLLSLCLSLSLLPSASAHQVS